jgi:putative FmdB family regulatory protein
MHAMPIYEYACTACGERTEAKQGFDDPPLEICPVCGGKLRKLYSPVGIVFKGSGFYSTDRKKTSRPPESKAAASDSDKGAGTKRGSDSAAKSDTKQKSKESSDG